MLKTGSLFSGIGGIELGLEKTGHFETEWFCEIDPHARAVLRKHWPSIPIYEDVREMDGSVGAVDVLTGGFPCQDLSKAGKRAGLAGARSGLFFEFTRLAKIIQPRWLIFENVPGFLSSNEGKDFLLAIETINECGYGVAWRVLDSKYFGVPQTRRRVFIVGYLGNPCPPEVLFEQEGGLGDIGEGGQEGKAPTGAIGERTVSSLVLRMREGKPGGGKGPLIKNEQSLTLATANDMVVFRKVHRAQSNSDYESWEMTDRANTLNGFDIGGDRANELVLPEVRKLTPVEFERLQGFPDDWTEGIDSRRYRQLGNAVSVPVVTWIGNNIKRIDNLERIRY